MRVSGDADYAAHSSHPFCVGNSVSKEIANSRQITTLGWPIQMKSWFVMKGNSTSVCQDCSNERRKVPRTWTTPRTDLIERSSVLREVHQINGPQLSFLQHYKCKPYVRVFIEGLFTSSNVLTENVGTVLPILFTLQSLKLWTVEGLPPMAGR